MPDFTIEQVLDTLNHDWAAYVGRFNRLSDEQKEAFLERQGFSRFRDLLAHIIAWWEEGHRIIAGIIDDPQFAWDEPHDIDAFNADSVQRFGVMDDDELFDYFNSMRIAMAVLVSELGDDALGNEDIASWLKADVIDHLQDHALP